jgi:cyanophycin synthetase
MKIVSTNRYVGPNVYAHFPVIRHVLDLGVLEEWPTGKLGEDFIGPLLDFLPGLDQHGCSYGEPGGFVRRLREDGGTWLGHVMEHIIIELQIEAGLDVTFGKTRSIEGRPGHYNMVFEYTDEKVGFEAGRLALDLIHHLLPEKLRTSDSPKADWNFPDEREDFIRAAQRRAFGPSTASLVKAAEERDIPWLRLNEYSLVQFGHGRHQQRIQATTTSRTGNIAVELAGDKEETNQILEALGLPVPQQRLVRRLAAAQRAAESLGYPCVIKPLNANHGRGVSIGLMTPEQVEVAYDKAKEYSRSILVESFIEGFDHRLLVVNGELVAAAKRVPGHVVGDGERTIEELVDIVNLDPRRGVGHEKVLTRLELDHQSEVMLGKVGYTAATVPPAGEIVNLRATANLSTGGTAIDVTDIIHPDNREMALRTINAIGLDVGGVDFLTTDISKSYRVTGGAICEVNAGPGFRMHVAPSAGKPRDVAGPVMDMLFPSDAPTRIPIAAITGTNGKTTTSRMLAHILKLHGFTVGLTSSDGVYVDGQLTVEGDMTGPQSARMILRDPAVDAAVMETARGGLLRSGMGYRKCNVAACLNVASDHLGLRDINTLEQLAEIKRIPIEVATDAVVLNADDNLCLQMADYSQAERLCYVTMSPGHTLVKDHVTAGGLAFLLEEGMNGHMITIYDRDSHIPLLWTHLIPATMEGRAMHNVQNAMFASALAYTMGISLENIRQGLRTFDSTFFQAPGRMNVFDEHRFKVILDYAHNAAAVQVMCDLTDRIDADGRKIVVLAAPGDRRDEDIVDVAKVAAGHFDHYICRRDDNPRGRENEEVPNMLRKTLIEGGVSPDSIQIVPEEPKALDTALEMALPGDLLLIFGDIPSRCWKQIVHFTPVGGAEESQPTEAHQATAELPSFELAEGLKLLRDERGVRIAREDSD